MIFDLNMGIALRLALYPFFGGREEEI